MKTDGQWWDKSWSVVTGCAPAGAGCNNCWASALAKRFIVAHGEDFSKVLLHRDRLSEPRNRVKQITYAVSLLGDLFHDQVPLDFSIDVIDMAWTAAPMSAPTNATTDATANVRGRGRRRKKYESMRLHRLRHVHIVRQARRIDWRIMHLHRWLDILSCVLDQ